MKRRKFLGLLAGGVVGLAVGGKVMEAIEPKGLAGDGTAIAGEGKIEIDRILLRGGRKSGKTYVLAQMAVREFLAGKKVLVCAPNVAMRLQIETETRKHLFLGMVHEDRKRKHVPALVA